MNNSILNWLNENVGKVIESPRRKSFNAGAHPIKIIRVDEEKEILIIKFVEGTRCPPLHFWMFERALDYIRSKKNKVVRLGAKVAPPYDEDTIEGKIWREPFSKPPKGSLGNKFTDSKEMISMSCWFVTNALVLYPIEIKLEKMIVFSN